MMRKLQTCQFSFFVAFYTLSLIFVYITFKDVFLSVVVDYSPGNKRMTNLDVTLKNTPIPSKVSYVPNMPLQSYVNKTFSSGNLVYPGNLCSDKDLFLFIYIHSAPAHFDRRVLIRKTFANPDNFPNDKLKVMFVFGALENKDKEIQKQLFEEAALYEDILQENFLDTYKNLSFKALSGLRYVSKNCRHVPFILKSDDDIFVNIFSLIAHLQSLHKLNDPLPKTIYCYVWSRMKVIRDVTSKWYVSPEEWEPDYYTHYCSGSAYIMTSQAAVAMYDASFRARFLWVDDFYITGILTDAAGVNLTSFKGVYKLHFNEFSELYEKNVDVGMTYIFSHLHDLDQYKDLWNTIARKMHGKTVSLFKLLQN